MQLNKNIILNILRKHKSELKKFGVKRIGLFGSYARDEQKETSDIDILVEFEEGQATYDNYINLIPYLENLFNKKVDVITIEGLKSIRIKEIKEDIKKRVIYV
ncbi:DNA polymerase beta domain protein region [Methanocaldococcus infernus ME]|uniref:protein adenylyltransferase n=1 Tax=Methanocaldococcus infernus (strain DSM 11812 / JCM 15783 / ME) TaxID=573063 RepID=D5VRQ1_METIM|nr:nucleotidyltransferase [Methanocaldococcus infernus]ADG13254.1 DNA polymerase beta domain protein region [Methanocaldococcus infernus ME]